MSSSLKRKRQITYTEEILNQAIEDVKAGATLNFTSRKYKIPRTTLHARVTNKHGGRLGTKPALSDKDEADLAAWIKHMCSIGCSVNRNQISDSIVLSLKTSKQKNPFVNKRPGQNWFNGFIRRHNLTENIRKNRRHLLKGIGINGTTKWFKNLNEHLKKGDLHGLSRMRTYSIGEVSLPMHLKNKTLWRAKEGPTVLITANATGHVLPPMIIFDLKGDSKSDVKLPHGWSVKTNDNADLSAELLYNYVTNHFYSWLTKNGIQLPIVLFFYQELASYLTKVLCDFCDKHKILLAILPPSPHQATTPLEIALFPMLRREFMKKLKNFITKWQKFSIGKDDFIERLKEALNCTDTNNSLGKGFYKCGLYPLSAERHIRACIQLKPDEDIEYVVQNEKQSKELAIINQFSPILECIESNLDPVTINSFRSAIDDPKWTGKTEDTNLFYLWRNIMKSVIFGRTDKIDDECSEFHSSNPNSDENQENEIPSDYTDLELCTEDKYRPISFIDSNLNIEILDKNAHIIVVHPNEYIEGSDSDCKIFS